MAVGGIDETRPALRLPVARSSSGPEFNPSAEFSGRAVMRYENRSARDQDIHGEDERPMSATADGEDSGLSGNRPGKEVNDVDGAPPARLRLLVAGLVLLESAVLIGAAVILVVAALASAQSARPLPTGVQAALVALAAIAIIVGGGLAFCARGVTRGLRWTRGPVLTWQLLQAGVGMPLSTTGAWWAGVPLLAVSVVVGVLIAGRHVITQPSERF